MNESARGRAGRELIAETSRRNPFSARGIDVSGLEDDAKRLIETKARPPKVIEHLAGLAIQAEAFADSAMAKTTVTNYRSAWQQWEAFCQEAGFRPIPAAPQHVQLYLTQLVRYGAAQKRPLKPQSANRHLIAIAAAHRALGLPWDPHHPSIRKTMEGIRRSLGTRQKGAKAFRTADILAMVQTCSLDVRSLRNKAIILIGFAGGFRRSELVELKLEDLRFEKEGVRILIRRSKTDQAGEGRTIGIANGQSPASCPVQALREWILAADLEGDHGPVFRQIDRWGSIQFEKLSASGIERAIKLHCRLAGLDPREYSSHGLRAGHVTEARSRGVDKKAVKRQTGHTGDAMIDRYDREANLWINNSSAALGL